MSGIFEYGTCLNLSKKEYRGATEELKVKLGELQRKAKNLKIPVLVIFEGLEAAGVGASINELLQALDPRGYRVVYNRRIDEMNRPMMWQYWKDLPGKGQFTIFDRSWYYSALTRSLKNDSELSVKNDFDRRFSEINETEKTLLESGMLIFKFFIYISKKEQKKRFKEAESDPVTAWKVTKDDWIANKRYDEIIDICEKTIQRTNTAECEWNLICGEDVDGAREEVLRILTENLDVKLQQEVQTPEDLALPYRPAFTLDSIDLSQVLEKEEYKDRVKKAQKKLFTLQHLLYIHRIPLVIAYEGWDAGGKGGNIKRLVEAMDPRGYDVIPVAAPNDIERAHHYLWRFWNQFPKPGHVAIFDRTWYGRVLVERIEGFAKKSEWKRGFKEIDEMERQWVNDGTILIKFWIHISKEEQLNRFNERTSIPEKNWKITDEDWRNREKWDLYKEAVEEMIARTDERVAPWSVIPGNNKYFARVFALETVIKAIEKELKKRKLL